MEIVLKDKDGNDVLSPRLTQWDQGVQIEIRDFYYSAQYVALHFYNSTKREIYDVTPAAGEHKLTARVPNKLLQEPYPITVHVYTMDGVNATDPDAQIEAHTVFTALIGVEPRMQPADFVEDDESGNIPARQVQEDLQRQIAEWEHDLAVFYGQTPTPAAIECYYYNGQMYGTRTGEEGAYEYSDAITGAIGVLYQDAATDILYFYENSQWNEWTVSGAIAYCKNRADVCDSAKSSMDTQYAAALATAQNTLRSEFNSSLDGCVIRCSTTVPTASDYSDETRPVITFVIGA